MPRRHAALQRLFVTDALAAGETVMLEGNPAHYLANVLRKRAGDETVLFNGRDGAWLCRLTDVGKKRLSVEPVEQIAGQAPPSDLWYGFAPLKVGRLDYVVQKATEMGVGTIQPVITRFTQVHHLNLDKLHANVVEAAEQCEVLSVPTVAPSIALETLLARWTAEHGERRLVFADEGEASASPLETLQALAGSPVGLLVGPEGGFSDDERATLREEPFVVPISLGPRILRADTAAVAALAVIQASIGDWR